jgi:hypothetical protein
MTNGNAKKYKWQFKVRFRRHAFGWRSQPAIKRIKDAVSEIKKVARKDDVLAAEGAVSFLERVSPALEHVDSSSGVIGRAVGNAIAALVPIIASVQADRTIREKWLERLYKAHEEDHMPYIEDLADYWGELCAFPDLASKWADDLMGATREALGSKAPLHRHFHGISMCLSALYAAGRYEEIVQLLRDETFWPYKRWAVHALAAMGKKAEAIRYAESCRDAWSSDFEIDNLCQDILLSSGFAEDAYRRYGLAANRAGTYVAWFRAVCRKYPHKKPADVLRDLAAYTPGEEGKWFAAAKDAGLFDEAVTLANKTPCSPQTLTRAARDFAEKKPDFAVEAGMAALRWLVEGYGYDIIALDVLNAYAFTMKAAEKAGLAREIHDRICGLVEKETFGDRFVTKVLGPRLREYNEYGTLWIRPLPPR